MYPTIVTQTSPTLNPPAENPAFMQQPNPPVYLGQPQVQVYQANPAAFNPAKSTSRQKFINSLLPAFGMAAGTCLTLTGGLIGMNLMGRVYLNTKVGITIFKIFAAIFFPMSYGCSVGAGLTIAVPIFNIFCPCFAFLSALFLAIPFTPILFGASLGYPGVNLTVFSYNHFRKIIDN